MELVLPHLTVINRSEPYTYAYKDFPIFEADAPKDLARMDLPEAEKHFANVRERSKTAKATDDDQPSQPPPNVIIRVNVGSSFIPDPGNPSPFVWRDVGTVNCGTLSGMAAIYCAVMARR
ncbi:hypothetical protein SAMN05660350_04956 [Geodermatophilus obscurus]|uniref:Uncharacterized protein n=1 Tax=Geodermatophilus obscurus TaxID=1861 RepID=A0A1M7V174_9ACTN|nr:hypothetical protein [Geodermatophilus obscurus]SHN88964.1 hypothetical protein SAMN05660350_04956 [Geodermatophilus obscurus]